MIDEAKQFSPVEGRGVLRAPTTLLAPTDPNTTMPHTKLHHIALGAHDVEEVARFYRDIFDLDELDRHLYDSGQVRSIWLDLEGAILMVEHTDQPARRVHGIGHGPFLLAFRVDGATECERIEKSVQERGAHIEARTEHTSYFRDPEGNRVAVSHFPS